jgi:hypothetical protein
VRELVNEREIVPATSIQPVSYVELGGNKMSKFRFGTGFTLFILFFGLAMLESFQTGNWIKALFWTAIGITFLVADNLQGKKR